MENNNVEVNKKSFSKALELLSDETYSTIKKIAQKLQIVPGIGNNHHTCSISECIKNGFVVVDISGKPQTVTSKIFEMLKMSFHNNNKTLFGNFENVVNMNDDEYYANQIMHYFSTYGLESMGFKAMPYIPAEEFWKKSENAVKNIKENDRILVYTQLSDEEYENELVDYILNIKAPNESSVFYKNIFNLIAKEIDDKDIRSYEIKVIFYDVKNVFPKHPIDFLRYCVYLITRSTLMVKNNETIEEIKFNNSYQSEKYYYNAFYKSTVPKIVRGFKEYDLTKLASIFYRFKPLFLAFKTSKNKEFSELKPIINKIRKLAPKYHRPLAGLCVQNLFEMAKLKLFTEDEIREFIKTIDTRDIFKLCNAWANGNNSSKVIGIRNGKVYIKNNEFKKDIKTFDIEDKIFDLLKEEFEDRYSESFKDKVVIMPEYINYGLPISEKDFVGKYPNGTSILTSEDPVTIGVSWNNKEGKYGEAARVDIDLHLQSTTMHFGWNASRMDRESVIYSGDMTDARNGAAEAFYINDTSDNYIIDTRLYTGNGPLDMNLFVSKRKINEMHVDKNETTGQTYKMRDGLKYVYDPNEDVIPNIPLTIKNEGLNIGLYSKGKIYFYNKSISTGIVPVDHYEPFINGLVEKFENNMDLKYFFEMLRVPVYDSLDELKNSGKEYDEENIINLDPCVTTEKTLFEIFEK